MAWVAVGSTVVSGVAGALGSSKARKAAKKDREFQREQNEIAQTAFEPVPVNGLGGSGASFGSQNAQPGLQAGQVDFNALANTGTQAPPAPAGAPSGGGSIQAPTTIDIPGGGQVQIPSSSFSGGSVFDAIQQGQGGGDFASGDNNLGQVNLNAGDLDPAAAGARQIGTQNIGRAGQAQFADQDPRVQELFQAFNQQGADAGISNATGVQDTLLGGAGQAFGNASQDLFNQQQNPFQEGFQNSLFGQSQDSFNAIPGTQEGARAQQLDLLRQEAAPFEERAFSGLQNNLFSTGRLGTTGGGLQTEAFARGLGQADLSRQITAGNEGRAAQNSQLNLAQGQLGAGSGIRELGDQLLTGAQNRFAGTANLSQDLSANRQGLQQQQFGNLGSLLQNAFAPQRLQQDLQSGFLNNASSSLGINQGVQDSSLSQAKFGLDAANVQASNRLGGVTGSQAPASGGQNIFSQISAATAPSGGIVGTIQDVLANRKANQQQATSQPGVIPQGSLGI
jgi:hypothetical protein